MAEDTKPAADDKGSKVAKDGEGNPVLSFGTWDEASAQAKALGKHHCEAVGTAVAVVPDSD